jgi:hypothetical protein
MELKGLKELKELKELKGLKRLKGLKVENNYLIRRRNTSKKNKENSYQESKKYMQ